MKSNYIGVIFIGVYPIQRKKKLYAIIIISYLLISRLSIRACYEHLDLLKKIVTTV